MVGRVPDAVHVLVQEAGCGGVFGVETGEGGQVGEHQAQAAAHRAHVLAKQAIEHDGAGDLVAVQQRDQHDMRPRARAG
jgi:hypothetical protein